jgi:phage gpG-like protein
MSFNNEITGQLKSMEAKAQTLLYSFPQKAGDIALRFIDGNFKAQGYQGASFVKWKNVQRRMQGTKAYKYGKASAKTRNILIGKGRLRRGFRKQVEGAGAVRIINDAAYAQVHNEGLQAGRSKFTMPKRQFAPIEPNDSPVLVNAIRRMIERELKF